MSDLKRVYTRIIQELDPSPVIQEHLSKWNSEQELTVVGFGKAVYKMAAAIENSWARISPTSILSVPHGQIEDPPLSKIRVCKGARNNLPDDKSREATMRILETLSNLSEGSHLVILISGGGSACCTGVSHPLTLKEKASIIQKLSLCGASIKEINTVRKRLSTVKGGKLVSFIPESVSEVTVFVLSDVLGDPLDVIASGPTTPNREDPNAALQILQKYKVFLSQEVLSVLSKEETQIPKSAFERVRHIWVGNLGMALRLADGIVRKEFKWAVIRLSSHIQGEASFIGRKFGELALEVLNGGHSIPDELSAEGQTDCLRTREILDQGALCFIGGGETVVSMDSEDISYLGTGGRNQELVLSFTEVMYNHMDILREFNYNVEFLSAGTDGIDGPTDAGGALFTEELLSEKVSIGEYLKRHDSYGYFSSVNEAQNHVKVGHTGTNVLDIQILKISPKA